MAAYSLDTLLKRWSLNQLTSEQAIGQILQLIQELEARMKRLEQVPPAKIKQSATPSSAPNLIAPKEPLTPISQTTPTPAVSPTPPMPPTLDAPTEKSRSPKKH